MEDNEKENSYVKIIKAIFFRHFKESKKEFLFSRDEIFEFAATLNVKRPKNAGDVIYTFRYRKELPIDIQNAAPKDSVWIIRPGGPGKYKFVTCPSSLAFIIPSEKLAETKILDATPGIISKYAQTDEQALLAKLRYNRLIDIFTCTTCYSLQSHLRTSVEGMGQVETDELYIGLDKKGAHYVIPVQAKGGKDKTGIIQIEQDFAVCNAKFPGLIVKPIAAQFIDDGSIALFEFEEGDEYPRVVSEKHYRLVSSDLLSNEELLKYQRRID